MCLWRPAGEPSAGGVVMQLTLQLDAPESGPISVCATRAGRSAGDRTGPSRVTHSRKQAVTAGHLRTQRRRALSSGGPSRTPEDTRGHTTKTVRDREAPGSNPGPPIKNRIQIEVFACSV